MNCADRIIEKIKEKKNYTIVGLDPRVEQIPDFIKDPVVNEKGDGAIGLAEAIYQFNKYIIDLVAPHVGFVKPQSAFYEQYESHGIAALEKTIEYAKSKGLIVILDAKRNDIGSTAKAYADAYLAPRLSMDEEDDEGKMTVEVDLLTVTPYLGYDGIKPFVENSKTFEKGIFVLVKTSNPSSGDFQDLDCGGKKLYEIVAQKVNEWGNGLEGDYGYNPIGAVVGATYPEEAKKLRALMPKVFFLVPGYGAQGGDGHSVVNCFNDDGLGALVNSSRGIIHPHEENLILEDDFKKLVEGKVKHMRNDINDALRDAGKLAWEE